MRALAVLVVLGCAAAPRTVPHVPPRAGDSTTNSERTVRFAAPLRLLVIHPVYVGPRLTVLCLFGVDTAQVAMLLPVVKADTGVDCDAALDIWHHAHP